MRRPAFNPHVLLACAVLLLALAEHFGLHLLLPLENRLSDHLARLHAQTLQPDPDIVIVDIDEYSLARMNEQAGQWPWPRAIHGELIEGMRKQGPRAIVFDILFAEQDRYRPESDAYFNEVVRATPNVYFPIIRQGAEDDAQGIPLARYAAAIGIEPTPAATPDAKVALLLPYAIDAASWRVGTINFLADADGVGRRYALYTPAHGWRIPSLAARVAADLGFSLPPREQIVLGWRGRAVAHTRIAYADLYEDFGRSEPRRDPAELKDKIVIIGTTASGLHDVRATPVSSLHPAVDIIATAISNLKNGDFMRPAAAASGPLLTLALIAGLLAAFHTRRNTLQTGLFLVAATGGLYGAGYAAVAGRYLLPVLTPLAFAWLYYFAAALYEYLRERRAREQTVRVFNRFLDPRVVQSLVDQGETVDSLSGQARTITVLFSDIRGFTTLSETRSPGEIVSLLNRYFSRQVEVIFRHGGTLDKFIGDAIMAFWGAPGEDPDHARHAVAAALDMVDQLNQFKQELGAVGDTFDIGIGIHTGPAVVGFIGSERRQDYTAIGDTVNLASRIEGQTKGIARILVSANTVQACAGTFDFVDHGSYKVKGRAQAVRLFEPLRQQQ